MFAPKPGVLRATTAALNSIDNLLRIPEEGKGTWDPVKDSQVHYDYIVLGGRVDHTPFALKEARRAIPPPHCAFFCLKLTWKL